MAEPVGEPLQSQPVGCASFPEGDALGKEGRSRPHSLTAGRSQPIIGKLSAFAKASPFRERWHGEAVTERVLPGRTLSVAYGDSSPEGRALGKEGRSRPHSSTAGRSLPLSCKLYALAKASPFRERWHGEAVTERVAFRDEPLPSFRFAKCQLPRGKLSSSSVNDQKEPAPIPSLDKPVLSCYDGIISNSRRLEQLVCKTNGGKAR